MKKASTNQIFLGFLPLFFGVFFNSVGFADECITIWSGYNPYAKIVPSIHAFESSLPNDYQQAMKEVLERFPKAAAITPPAPPTPWDSRPESFLPVLQNNFFFARLWGKFNSIQLGLSERNKTPKQLAESMHKWMMSWPSIGQGSIYRKVMNEELFQTTFKDLIKEIEPIELNLNQFSDFTKAFQTQLNLPEFTPEVFWRASANYVAMSLVTRHYGVVGPKTEAMQALALLHPLVDDYLDQAGSGIADTGWIENALNGQTVVPQNKSQAAMLTLFMKIVKAYPPAEHPMLYSLFKEMHKAQLVSKRLQTPDTSPNDLTGATIYKGGICWALAVYASIGHMSPKEFKYFFTSGALLQFNDDLNDLESDLADGIETIFTRDYRQNKNMGASLSTLYGLQEDFNRNYSPPINDPAFHRVNFFATRFLTFMGFFSSDVAKQQLYFNFGNRFSAQPERIEDLLRESFKLLGKKYGENSPFLLLLRYSFLGGKDPAKK